MAGYSIQSTPGSAQRARPTAAAATDDDDAGFTQHTVGGIFDTAFDLYKRHFAGLALIVACVFIPTQVVLHAAGNLWLKPLVAQTSGANPDPFAVFLVVVLAFLAGAPAYGVPGYLSLLTSYMASGPVAVAVAGIMVGRPVNIAAAYRRAVPTFWRLFVAWNVLVVLAFMVLVLVAATLSTLLVMITAGMTALGIPPSSIGAQYMAGVYVFLLIFIPYVVMCAVAAVVIAFAAPLIALENLSVTSAVERNSQLVGRNVFWRVCFTIMLLPVLIFGLQFLVLLSATGVVEALKWPAWAVFVLNTGLSSLIAFFFQPYWMVFITLLYFDVRVRREGLDVRYLSDNLPELDPLLAAPLPQIPGQDPPAASQPSGPAASAPVAPGART